MCPKERRGGTQLWDNYPESVIGWLILTVVLALLGCSGGSSDIGSSDNNSEDTGNLGEKLDNISSTSGSDEITV